MSEGVKKNTGNDEGVVRDEGTVIGVSEGVMKGMTE